MTTPNGSRVVVEQHDCAQIDVTEAVQVAYDLVLSSMDFGSGFLCVEEVLPLQQLAKACGFDDKLITNYMKART